MADKDLSSGEFREEQINGKPFYIFTLLPQTNNSDDEDNSIFDFFPRRRFSSFSDDEDDIFGGDYNYMDLSPQPRFLCPSSRVFAEAFTQKDREVEIVPFKTSPYFYPNMKGLDREVVRYLRYTSHEDERFCKGPVLPLFWCRNEKVDAFCRLCRKPEIASGYYYLCVKCDGIFHKECVEAPLAIKSHPSYPLLSLQLYLLIQDGKNCGFCQTQLFGMAYHNPTYNLSMHPVCATKPIPIVIDHFKRHPHPLTFFPKQASLACDVCGLVKQSVPTYVCARCVFVVHRDCIYFPYVIKISRHRHRISFTYSLPSGDFSCGVCRRKVDNHCGAYSCVKCDDGYFVHSRCALRRDLWDGKELEGVPEEEPEEVVEPFKIIADGIILHFSHDHHLKLDVVISTNYDENKYCQACILPIYEGNYYSCVDDHCEFILHEACACAPLKLQHQLLAHTLSLKVVTNKYDGYRGYFSCKACLRQSCGFVYEAPNDYTLDLRCASVFEPFDYGGHEHPLFLALSPDEEKSAICRICRGRQDPRRECRKLNCIECDYIICFRCATLPYKARYKHDSHFLTFREPMVASDQSDWCEVCEKKVVYSDQGGFYGCDEYCCTTLHVDCLLGRDPYFKPGQNFYGTSIQILRNSSMSRPFCHTRRCGEERCLYKVVMKKDNVTYCSWACW